MKLLSLVCIVMFVLVSCDNENDKTESIIKPDYEDTSKAMGNIARSCVKTISMGGAKMDIREDVVFAPSSDVNRIFRIPSVVITNEGSILMSCESRSEIEDKGEIDILVARLERNNNVWHIRKVIPHDENNYGRSMNPIFVIDRLGSQGRKGRIYLFASHMKNPDYGVNQKTEEADMVYKYSDDDGKTWSYETSLKNLWDTTQYDANYPSACNGIQMSDGTLLVPTMIARDGKWRSGVVAKRAGMEWQFSFPTDIDGDNESSVYIDTQGNIILDCRTMDHLHRKYQYNISNNELMLLEGREISVNHDLKAEITRVYNDQTFYLSVYVDSHTGERENATLFGSDDGISWKKLYHLQDGFNGFGYGNAAYYNGQLVVAFEDYQNRDIKLHFLSDLLPSLQQIIKR